MDKQKIHDAIARKLTDEGKLIEVGWQAMLLFSIPAGAKYVALPEVRKVFFMGAQHLYASIMAIMAEDREPTDDDMRRMKLIHDELEAFRIGVTSRHTPGHS